MNAKKQEKTPNQGESLKEIALQRRILKLEEEKELLKKVLAIWVKDVI